MAKITSRIVAGVGLAYIVMFITLALNRISYPYELEFLEGTSGVILNRLVHGKAFYVKPTLDFIPSNYTPLYYYLSLVPAAFLGPGLLPLRVVSLLSTVATLVLLYAFAYKESKSHVAGMAASGMYAASYGFLGAWFDIARNDSLFLCLLMAAAYLVRFYHGWRAAVTAGTLLALSFFTKQTAAMIAPALLLYTLLTSRRQFLVFATATCAVGAILCGTAHALTRGWFTYYVFSIAGLHAFNALRFREFWPSDVLRNLAPALVLLVTYLVITWRTKERERFSFYLLLSAFALGSSWMIRSHEGAYVNVLMPAVAALSLSFGALVGQKPSAQKLMVSVHILAVAQLALTFYLPTKLIPTTADRIAGDKVLSQIRNMRGEVWLPSRSYLAELCGRRSYANAITIWDVLADPKQSAPGGLQQEILSSLQKRRFDIIVFDADPGGKPVSKPSFIDKFYRMNGVLPYDGAQVFRPVTGVKSRPEIVYTPK